MSAQRIFVNERSVVGQTSNEHAAGELIGNLAAVLRSLAKHLQEGGQQQLLTTSEQLAAQPLIRSTQGEVAFLDCLFKRRGSDQQVVRALVQKLLTNGPYTEELLRDHAGHHCERQRDTDRSILSGSSIAAAAAFQGWVVSMRDCAEYEPETLVVTFQTAQGESRLATLWHFIEPEHVVRIKRVYEPNPKHKRSARHNSGVAISRMDLTPDVAQQVLDRAVTMANEERLFALFMDRIYVFFEHIDHHYHGYCVDNPYEYQHRDARIFNSLCRLGWAKR